MNEHELRLLVRETIARQLAGQGAATAGHAEPAHPSGTSASFARFLLPSGPEGSCIIEPAVACNHCGFCKSYGH
jgi:hypothetical protein